MDTSTTDTSNPAAARSLAQDDAHRDSAATTNPLSRGELRNVAHAIRHRWPVSEKMREAAVTRLAMILADPEQSARSHIAAIRTMAELDKANALHEANQIALEAPPSQTIVNVTTTIDVNALRRMSDGQLREMLESRCTPLVPATPEPEDPDGSL